MTAQLVKYGSSEVSQKQSFDKSKDCTFKVASYNFKVLEASIPKETMKLHLTYHLERLL